MPLPRCSPQGAIARLARVSELLLGRAVSPSHGPRRRPASLPLTLACDLTLAQGARQGRWPYLTSQERTQRLGEPRRASTHPVC